MDEHVYFDETLNEQFYTEINRVRINPLQSVSGTGFSGNFSFDIDISKNMMWLPQETKLYMTFTGLQSTTANNTVNSICQPFSLDGYNVNNSRFLGCFNSGGVLNTLSKIHHELYSAGVIQAIENVPQCNQLLRQSQDNINEAEKNGSDPFFIIDSGDVVGSGVINPIINNVLSFRKNSYLETVVKNASRQGLLSNTNTSKNITLSSYLPLSMLQEQNKIYQSRHIIRCFIDPNWKSNILMLFRGTSPTAYTNDKRFCSYIPTGDAVTHNFIESTQALVANSISLSVSDVWLECTFVKISERPIGIRNLLLNPFNVTINNIPQNTGTNNFTISCAPHTHKIIIGFQNTIGNNSGFIDNRPQIRHANNAEDGNRGLRTGFQNIFNAINLRDITVRYLDNAYPNTPYNLNFYQERLTAYSRSLATEAAITDESLVPTPQCLPDPYDTNAIASDMVRAYNDFIEAMEYMPEDRPMTFSQWLHNPLFAFKFITTTNIASNIDIKVTFSDIIAPYAQQPINMYVLYYHKGLLTCDYQEDDVKYTYNYLV